MYKNDENKEVNFTTEEEKSQGRERSKREDSSIYLKDIGNPNECKKIGHLNTWFPKEKVLCLRCGALNTMET